MGGVVQGRKGIIMGINRSGDKDRTRILIINFEKSILMLFMFTYVWVIIDR